MFVCYYYFFQIKNAIIIFRFIAADGVEHVVTYIADERGYRVTGDAIVGASKAAPAPAPRPAPARAPARPASSGAAVVQVVPVQAYHAVPVQYVQLAQAVPQRYSTVQVQSGFAGNLGYCHYASVGSSRSGEQEVVGHDGTRYVLKKL